MQVRSHKLRDQDFGNQWTETVQNNWTYDDFDGDSCWRENWISFDCATYRARDRRVYLGVTCFDENHIFKAWDRETETFVDLGYNRVANRFDAKFHRSLIQAGDGYIYGAVALLHCIDKYFEASGGAIVRYQPESGNIEKLAIPVAHTYIQSLVFDESRQVFYGLGFHPQCLLKYDLTSGEGRMLGYITSGYGGDVMSENLGLDDDGCVWSNWGLTRAWDYSVGNDAFRLCKYDPAQDRLVYLQHGLPTPGGQPGYTKVESFHNFGDGFLYAGAGEGAFYRIDPEDGKSDLLCVPKTEGRSRLASLVKAEEGLAYGIVGRDGQCRLMELSYKTGEHRFISNVVDDAGVAMYQCHDLVITEDNVIYACENDNPNRSSYLWEIVL